MRVSYSFCVGLVFTVPLATGTFLVGGVSEAARVPRVGETAFYDGGDVQGGWVVIRRMRSTSGVVLELRNGDEVAFTDPCRVRGESWGFGF